MLMMRARHPGLGPLMLLMRAWAPELNPLMLMMRCLWGTFGGVRGYPILQKIVHGGTARDEQVRLPSPQGPCRCPILRGCAHVRAAQAEARGEQIRHRVGDGWGFSKRLRFLNSLEVSKHF